MFLTPTGPFPTTDLWCFCRIVSRETIQIALFFHTLSSRVSKNVARATFKTRLRPFTKTGKIARAKNHPREFQNMRYRSVLEF